MHSRGRTRQGSLASLGMTEWHPREDPPRRELRAERVPSRSATSAASRRRSGSSARRGQGAGRDPPHLERRGPRRGRAARLRRNRERLRAGSTAGRKADVDARRRRPRRHPRTRRRAHPSRLARRPRRRDRAAPRGRELRGDRGRRRRHQRHGPRRRAPAPTRAARRPWRARLAAMLAHGTTTAEAKSGYGLTVEGRDPALWSSSRELAARTRTSRASSRRSSRRTRFLPSSATNRAEWVRDRGRGDRPRAARERPRALLRRLLRGGRLHRRGVAADPRGRAPRGPGPARPRRRARALGRRDARGGARRGIAPTTCSSSSAEEIAALARGRHGRRRSCPARRGGCARGARRRGR